jgi:hypothetical protein
MNLLTKQFIGQKLIPYKTTANMGLGVMSADGKHNLTSPIQQHRSRGTDRSKR